MTDPTPTDDLARFYNVDTVLITDHHLADHHHINGLEAINGALLFYPDGTVRFMHRCDRGERGVVLCAPALAQGHTVTRGSRVGRPTVRPSILCPDCGTHGFVTDGRWSR